MAFNQELILHHNYVFLFTDEFRMLIDILTALNPLQYLYNLKILRFLFYKIVNLIVFIKYLAKKNLTLLGFLMICKIINWSSCRAISTP